MNTAHRSGESPKRSAAGQAPDRRADLLSFDSIEHAVNDAAKRVNAIWLSLVFLMTYVLIATGKITHKDLFFDTPVKLPLIGVDVPLRGYFVFVPAFVLSLHFYFAVQLSGLAEKLREYETILLKSERKDSHRERLRQRLDNSLFAKVLGGPRSSLTILIRIVAWVTMVVAPVWLLLFIQLTYLPRQDSLVTNWQRAVIVTDVCLALVYVLRWVLRKDGLLSKISDARGLEFLKDQILSERGWPDFAVAVVAAFTAVWISFYAAVFPWEVPPGSALTRDWFMAGPDPVTQVPANWFSNRLVLSDLNLIDGIDLTKVKVTRSARNRKLVAAIFDRSDLRQVDFTGSDLSYASLVNADLRNSNLGCAEEFISIDGLKTLYGCVELREATLNAADLRDASLEGARMFGASLRGTRLDRAILSQAELQGAILDQASLRASDMWMAGLDGASLKGATLDTASLRSARVRGADLSDATLFGAILDSSLAQNASFEGAQLQGASMARAHFEGASFLAAAVYGTDVTSSNFNGARIVNVLTSPRWKRGTYYGEYFPGYWTDFFGKEGDTRTLGDSGYTWTKREPESEDWYDDYKPISQEAIDRFTERFLEATGQSTLSPELKHRLSRLNPDTTTADWPKLVERSASQQEYVEGLGDRLLVIACAKIGGTNVVRGLISSQVLCPFKEKINSAISTRRRPDGAICENRDGISAALEQGWSCPKLDGQRGG